MFIYAGPSTTVHPRQLFWIYLLSVRLIHPLKTVKHPVGNTGVQASIPGVDVIALEF